MAESQAPKIDTSQMTEAQRARMERNRAKAIALRQAKLVSHPYAKKENGIAIAAGGDVTASIIKVQGSKYIDSGGGFLIEEQQSTPTAAADVPSTSKGSKDSQKPNCNADDSGAVPVPITYVECLECGDSFADSYLLNNFSYAVCDKCRDTEERHTLITRTEAKAEYLLKDCDLDKREPPLRFICRKNPNNVRWGDMKLYLNLQVEKRAMEVWGSEEELLRQHESRAEKREVSKIRKYNKQMKHLRMQVRSSLYNKTSAAHVHEFGPDTYNEEEDNYTHTCLTCPYTETYEKM